MKFPVSVGKMEAVCNSVHLHGLNCKNHAVCCARTMEAHFNPLSAPMPNNLDSIFLGTLRKPFNINIYCFDCFRI